MGESRYPVVPVICASHKGHGCLVPTADQVQNLSPQRLEVEVGADWVLGGRHPEEEPPCQACHLLPLILSLCLTR